MNKNTQISTTVLKGIQTNVEAGAQDGTCQHIVNLRNKHGEWRSVGEKNPVSAGNIQTIAEDDSMIHKILLHPALGDLYRIVALRATVVTVETDLISVFSLDTDTLAWSKVQDVFSSATGTESFSDMQVFGRWLVVNTSTGVRHYVLGKDLATFIEIDYKEPDLLLIRATDWSSFYNDEATSHPNVDGREAHMGPYYRDYGEAKRNNRARGGVFARLAIRGSDGHDLWVSQIMYTHLGLYNNVVSGSSLPTSAAADPDFVRYPEKSLTTNGMYSTFSYDSGTGTSSDYRLKKYCFSGLMLEYQFDATAIAWITKLRDNNVASKLVLYISRVFDTHDYTVKSWVIPNPTGAFRYMYPDLFDETMTAKDAIINNSLFYEGFTRSLDDVIADGTAFKSHRVNLKKIYDITTDQQLMLEGHSWFKLKGDHVQDYNQRMHLSNVTTYLQAIGNPFLYKREIHVLQQFWASNLGEYPQTNVKADTTYTPTIELFFDVYFTLNNQKYHIRKQIANANDYVFVMTTRPLGGSRPDEYIYTKMLAVKPIYSHPGAAIVDEIVCLMKKTGTTDYKQVFSSKQRNSFKHPTGDDIVMHDNQQVFETGSVNSLLPISFVLSETVGGVTTDYYASYATRNDSVFSSVITDTNRLQVSYQENPLIFPAKHSYRFGTISNRLVAAMPAAQTMSEGQFGQFPLYIFTSMGIYALEQGDSNALYSNIRPLNQEVAINKNLIIAVQGAVFFVTRQSMKAMVGGDAKWVGEALDGPFASLLDSSIYFNRIITDQWIANIEPVVISNIPFADQLEASQIAYDHQEEEIIIQAPAKQFVYCLKSGVWVERSDNYDFLYPAWPGYEFAREVAEQGYLQLKLYNPHQEQDNQATPIYVESNRIVTDYKAVKAFSNILLNCNLHILDNKRVGLYIFGSEDDDVYKLLAGREEIGHKRRMKINHIPAGLRSIIIILSGTVDQLSAINEIITEFVPRYQGKIR